MNVAAMRAVHATGREKWLGHLVMVCFAAMIAGSFSLGHKAAPYIGPMALNAVRFVIGVSVLTGLFLVVARRLPRFPAAPWRFAILGGLMAIYFVLMFVALRITNPVSTGAVFTLTPLMSAGFAWLFMRQVARPVVLFALLIGAAGAVWVIFKGDIAAIANFDIGRGELIFLVGCACHAAYTPLLRKFNRGESGLYFTVFMTGATMLWLLLAGGRELAATDFTTLPPIVWVTILYLATATTAVTFFLLQFASMRLPASKVMAYGYLTPCFIIVYEGLSGHGWPAISVAIGALVTAMALVVLALAPDG
ncbi:MAG: DMT family transporter [Salaquimonas sp.]|jgi:drug/metabolite transporter (DMT)-like permease|nr:DMT family transporter [Salaquimonas sp.]